MRPAISVLEDGDISPFLNATLDNIYLRKENSYIKVPPSPIRILLVCGVKEVEVNGVTTIQEKLEKIIYSKVNDESLPIKGKILIVQEPVFCLPDSKLIEIKKNLGIAGIAIPEVFYIEGDKTFTDILKVKFF